MTNEDWTKNFQKLTELSNRLNFIEVSMWQEPAS